MVDLGFSVVVEDGKTDLARAGRERKYACQD